MKAKLRSFTASVLVVFALLISTAVPAFADGFSIHWEISDDGTQAHLIHGPDIQVYSYFADDCNGRIYESEFDPPLSSIDWQTNESDGQAPLGYITAYVSYRTRNGWSEPQWYDATRNCSKSTEGSICWTGMTTNVAAKNGRYIWSIQVDFTDGSSDEILYGTAGGPTQIAYQWAKPIKAARANFSLYIPEERRWYQTPFLEGSPCRADQVMHRYGQLGMQAFINPDTPGDICYIEYLGDNPASVNSTYAQHACDTYWPGGPRPGWHENMVALPGGTGAVYDNGTSWGYWEGDKVAGGHRAPLFAPGDQRSLAKTACYVLNYCP